MTLNPLHWFRRKRAVRQLKKLVAEFPQPSQAVIDAMPNETAKAFRMRDNVIELIRKVENGEETSLDVEQLLRMRVFR